MCDRVLGLRVCDRVLTDLIYFNDNWLPEHGGYLRLYRPEPGREEEGLLGLCHVCLCAPSPQPGGEEEIC